MKISLGKIPKFHVISQRGNYAEGLNADMNVSLIYLQNTGKC